MLFLLAVPPNCTTTRCDRVMNVLVKTSPLPWWVSKSVVEQVCIISTAVVPEALNLFFVWEL